MQANQAMNVLTDLPNIGSDLAKTLASAGVSSYEDLVALGSVDVALKIRAGLDPGACYNLLYALEGAIRGVRWHTIPKQERDKLRRDFDYAAGY